ncbi:MAG TPA: 50S ribosomal protein L11 methyltransferase [Micromonosporaceae bacterium]|nr:50S ribosomal protein L11 methyltransferase [Micromonosporaceae bacterium]
MDATLPADFVLANTRLAPTPHVPEILLHLADEAIELWERTESHRGRTGLAPPFWAFAWAGGQALARYVLDHPDLVAGRRVLDFAAGSGLVAIAAARAGAAAVTATDPLAVAATELNAAANGVVVKAVLDDVCEGPGGGGARFDVVLAGDVCYSRPMTERVLPFLDRARAGGARVLVGDPGRAYLPAGRLRELARYEVAVLRSLEDAQIKTTTVWELGGSAGD